MGMKDLGVVLLTILKKGGLVDLNEHGQGDYRNQYAQQS